MATFQSALRVLRTFIFNVRSACSLKSTGYSRPPFLLLAGPEKCSIGKWFHRLLDNKGNADRTGFSTPLDTFPLHRDCRTHLYLWPDGLRIYFFFFSFIFIAAPIISWLVTDSIPSFHWEPHWKPQGWNGYFGLYWPFLLSALSISVSPILVYWWWRVPVICSLWATWPASATQQLSSVPGISIAPKGNRYCTLIKSSIPVVVSGKSSIAADATEMPVYWSPNGSRQEAFLRAAICEFFERDQRSEKGHAFWQLKAFRRWFCYWLAPIWISYIILVSILIFFAYGRPLIINSLYVCSILWLLLSIFFIWGTSIKATHWLEPNYKMMNAFYPPPLAAWMNKFESPYYWYNEKLIKLIFSILTGVFLTFFIAILQKYSTDLKFIYG